ncbi:MAG: SDR family NAD(P)-dependent oxidoreductase [Hyphomicrobiaceae bacterium]
MSIRFDDRVAIVTGAGTGLGRAHALGLAARGAKVVVNDLGVARDGTGASLSPAESVVAEITAAGGEAMAHGANVTDPDAVTDMVEQAHNRWGRIDILINNAGILRDKTFAKMTIDEFRDVVDVHLMGSVTCTKAVWEQMRVQNYGRIVFTSSSSGLYGNFGQSNYGAAKAAMVGLMNVLHLEGAKYDIRVNTLAPTAATRMTEDLMPAEMLAVLKPESITPGVLYLVSENAPSRCILAAGAGCFARTMIYETPGIYLAGEENSPESVAAQFEAISASEGHTALQNAFAQTEAFAARAASAQGLSLPPRQGNG